MTLYIFPNDASSFLHQTFFPTVVMIKMHLFFNKKIMVHSTTSWLLNRFYFYLSPHCFCQVNSQRISYCYENRHKTSKQTHQNVSFFPIRFTHSFSFSLSCSLSDHIGDSVQQYEGSECDRAKLSRCKWLAPPSHTHTLAQDEDTRQLFLCFLSLVPHTHTHRCSRESLSGETIS